MTARVTKLPTPPARGPMRWFMPDEDLDDELVVSGDLRERILTLERELRFVDRFLEEGIDPPTRVILSGPSGTGKTLAARWFGWRLRLPLAVIEIAGAVGSHLGETSKNLQTCMQDATSVKSILFLDEIDALCANREGSGDSAASAELARATSTLLQQLDWLEPNRIVFAATNFREGLDSALARRLPTQIAFAPPDAAARRKMLDRWLGKSCLSPEDLDEIAEKADGMAGAALRAFAMAEARRALVAAGIDERAEKRRRAQLVNGTQQVLSALGGSQ